MACVHACAQAHMICIHLGIYVSEWGVPICMRSEASIICLPSSPGSLSEPGALLLVMISLQLPHSPANHLRIGARHECCDAQLLHRLGGSEFRSVQ